MTMFSNPKYETVKLFLNQIVMAFFGLVTVFAASKIAPAVTVICGALGIGLYFFLIYNMMWTIGANDRIRADAGRYEYKAFKPFKMALIAGIPNFIFALLSLFSLIPATETAGRIGMTVSKLIQGYYLGISNLLGLADNPFVWIATSILGVLVAALGYKAGYAGFKIIKTQPKENKE